MNDRDISENRHLSKAQRQLTERFNRIAELTPGTGRCWRLAGIAQVTRFEAADAPNDETRAALESDALFLERLAWDLVELRNAVRGTQNGHEPRGSRHWVETKVERP